jgi:hypothetical protein
VQLPGDLVADEIIEIQTATGYYKCSSVYWGKEKVVKGIIDGKYFRDIDGRSVQGDEINIQDIDWYKGLHYSHFGLLMELKASGLVLGDKVKVRKFQGEECLAIDFTCDTIRLKNKYFKNTSWTIFLAPENYSMKGFENEGSYQIKGYAVYTGNLGINGINVPMVRTYFSSINNSFVGIDLLTNAK